MPPDPPRNNSRLRRSICLTPYKILVFSTSHWKHWNKSLKSMCPFKRTLAMNDPYVFLIVSCPFLRTLSIEYICGQQCQSCSLFCAIVPRMAVGCLYLENVDLGLEFLLWVFVLLFYIALRSKLFTLNDFLSQLEDEEDTDFASADIFISPQRDRQNSDEDDVNDNVQEEVSANDLPGRQLRSTAEVQAKLRDGSQITLGDVSRKAVCTQCCVSIHGFYKLCVYMMYICLCAYLCYTQ